MLLHIGAMNRSLMNMLNVFVERCYVTTCYRHIYRTFLPSLYLTKILSVNRVLSVVYCIVVINQPVVFSCKRNLRPFTS